MIFSASDLWEGRFESTNPVRLIEPQSWLPKVSLKSADRGWICAKRLDATIGSMPVHARMVQCGFWAFPTWTFTKPEIESGHVTEAPWETAILRLQVVRSRVLPSTGWHKYIFVAVPGGMREAASQHMSEIEKEIYWGAKRQTDAKRSYELWSLIHFKYIQLPGDSVNLLQESTNSGACCGILWQDWIILNQTLPRVIISASHLLLSCEVSICPHGSKMSKIYISGSSVWDMLLQKSRSWPRSCCYKWQAW